MVKQYKNYINGEFCLVDNGSIIDKRRPHDGFLISSFPASAVQDVNNAVNSAQNALCGWKCKTAVERGELLFALSQEMINEKNLLANIVAEETGKSPKEARGEVEAAIACTRYFASEGWRLHGRINTSGVSRRVPIIRREPMGVAALIVPANTPIANILWKLAPALICGNTVVLKSAEDAPGIADAIMTIINRLRFPSGVVNLIHGEGGVAGEALINHAEIDVLSFTGSSSVGRHIASVLSERLIKYSLELGGKNPFVVMPDADVARAVRWAILSSFSNAGQRCAASSRIFVHNDIYDTFKDDFIAATKSLKVGPTDTDDLGPVINYRQLDNMIREVSIAVESGANLLCGGGRVNDTDHSAGYYMTPTVLENEKKNQEILRKELFGPITVIQKVDSFEEVIIAANDCEYGLTSAIHTNNIALALEFADRVETGLVSINAGTFGSEPHMPFGGRKSSGNGTREPGLEALDVYSQLKNVIINY